MKNQIGLAMHFLRYGQDIRVRRARLADAAFLPDLERTAARLFSLIPSLAWIADDGVMSTDTHARHVAADTSWVAASPGGSAAGFLAAEAVGDALHIWQICVHPDVQRRGLGGSLIDAAIGRGRAAGLRHVTLTTFRQVPWNEPYYARRQLQTLQEHQLGPRLRTILAGERACGVPSDLRCAMTLALCPGTRAADGGRGERHHG